MRIWDISPNKLCDKHLLGEHRELHAIWVIIDSDEILQGTYAQLEGGIELGVMATWSDNQSFSQLWRRFSDYIWVEAKPLKDLKL